jgi:ribose 1,5-bisphosphokinase
MTPGEIVYVIGPSGAGKDSVIAFARAASDPARVAFAHRYITRPALPDAENHIALSPAEFDARRQAGWFALHWQSHGLAYGIGCEIEFWRASGMRVVINGSRAHLPEAFARYPDLLPVLVSAPAEIRQARLRARNRESLDDIARRLDRQIEAMTEHPRMVTIDNGGTLEAAGTALLKLLG